ncbi:MAG TPA: ABC transporter permease subunit [Solirubrobacteraceae bacterium]|jgi:ABC-type transport system involved in multi-copper enzyme maturation permease subunit|nr:ABC transporter permease subunit [Solirubrobacteraceae bacterium]
MSAISPAAPAAIPPAAGRGADGSLLTVARQMFGADLLKLRKKRGPLIWAIVLGWAPILIMFVVKAIQHSSNAAKYEPAGGLTSFHDGLRLLGGLFFGPLVAILIGVEAGTGDASAGVFRDLVVTGRSRVALFASRVPAALALNWFVILCGYGLVLAGTFAFAGNLPTPSGGLILEGVGFLVLATGVLCAVAVGFASLTTSRPAAIIALIAWQVIASPLISSISSLGNAREAILGQAITHFSPITLDGRATNLTLSGGTAIVVIVVWLAVFLGLGAWRTARMDA